MAGSFESCIARILDKTGRPVGAGCLVAGNRLATCAHVIIAALGLSAYPSTPPEDEISLDFPLVLRGQVLAARLIRWQLPGEDGGGDTALLELLSTSPAEANPARLIQAADLWQHALRAFGFPSGYENGVWASGRILGREAGGWFQVEDVKQTGYFILPGFSGTPVWDDDLDGVVGLIAAVDLAPNVRTAFMIPVEALNMDLGEANMSIPCAKIFLSYKRNANPDQALALYLRQYLSDKGHEVFIDTNMRAGTAWLEEIDRQIRGSDFLLVLLSPASADSEMVQAEVHRAHEYNRRQGKPRTLPVRVAYADLLPYTIDSFLYNCQYVVWSSEQDNQHVAEEIQAAILGKLPDKQPVRIVNATEAVVIGEDGRPMRNGEALPAPLPAYDPRFLEELDAPGGALKVRDQLYIERAADPQLKRQVLKGGTTTTIRAPRQCGKSSLLERGLYHARQKQARMVKLDLQSMDRCILESYDGFLRCLADTIAYKLGMGTSGLDRIWSSRLGLQDRLTSFMEEEILPNVQQGQLVLALDEADRLMKLSFASDFFGLLRVWHNYRADSDLWGRLNLVLVISTEPYLLIRDLNQSPFNVGLTLNLKDFNAAQVADLNVRHGAPVRQADFPHLMLLLNGHPYLTRKALYHLVIDQLSWVDLERIAATDEGPFSDHLRYYFWRVHDEPTLSEAVRQILRSRRPDEQAAYRLMRAGLLGQTEESYRFRCDLYRRYFEGRL